MLSPRRFRFLHEEHELVDADWDHAEWSKLWRYNLHYFDDLDARDATERTGWQRDLIARWIAENPPSRGSGWEPYCLSLRIVNWCKWQLAGNALGEPALHSLAVQARYLRRRLEVHLLGNHLFANLKALLFAGALFEGHEADSFLAVALHGLRRELDEQMLADGGHFERSPMYHAILLEDVLDMLQLSRRYPGRFPEAEVAQWRSVAQRMLRWLAVMTHPDGQIALFNDAAFGIAPRFSELAAHAQALSVVDDDPSGFSGDATGEPGLTALPDSGYVRLHAGSVVVLADVGEVGPAYLPGHAHADTLSFELSFRGRRVFVDSGTSRYDVGAERLRQRGTAAHNTVQIDEADSSEVWSSFRVARRAHPLGVRMGRQGDQVWLSAAHDGYLRLPGRPLHRRTFRLMPGSLTLIDVIEGHAEQAVARLRLHPELEVELLSATTGKIRLGSELCCEFKVDGSEPRIVRGTFHPEFGASEPCAIIELPFAGKLLTTTLAFR
jgi:uncharacterized heparinase superfamily protein